MWLTALTHGERLMLMTDNGDNDSNFFIPVEMPVHLENIGYIQYHLYVASPRPAPSRQKPVQAFSSG